MFELVPLAVATLALARAAARALATGPPAIRRPPSEPPAALRPAHVDHSLFTRYRGAVCTTQELAARHLAADPGPLFLLAGVLWPASRFLNKLILITGRPDSGKTVLMRMMMESVAGLFETLPRQAEAGLYPGRGRMRWFVVDPTNAYLPLLYQVLPADVPIVRSTPVDAGGKRWAIREDITSPALNEALQDGLFPESLFQKAGDPFWYTKAREVTGAVVTVFHEKGAPWEFHDLIIPIKYPQYLKPLLEQCPSTRGMAQHELVGRLGRDITSSASSVVNKMAIAAALWQKAPDTFSLKRFLAGREVLHLAYTPDMIPCFAGIANALTRVLVLLGITRNDPHDHTILWLDEGRYLSDLAGLEDLAARGRGAGFGAIFAAQGTPGLISKWGEKRVAELLFLISTWVALSSGPDTAEAFCKMVGKVEGILKSRSHAVTNGGSVSIAANTGKSSTRASSSSSSATGMNRSTSTSRTTSTGDSVTITTSWSETHTESFQLTVRDAVLSSELTNLPYADRSADRIRGFAFNPEVGAFQFDAPFLQHFASLSEPLVGEMPLRPERDQRLMPWTLDDIRRLGLEATPALIAAVQATWEEIGGGA